MYNSVLVTKLINGVMLDGKKGVAQKVVYDAFDIIKEKSGKEPLDAFTEAMNNIMPALEVKARRVGGATYQVPIEVRPARRQTLALRVQQSLQGLYPGLARPLNFSNSKYNMNATPGSMLVEVGTEVNTVSEAVYSGQLVGEAIAQALEDCVVG